MRGSLLAGGDQDDDSEQGTVAVVGDLTLTGELAFATYRRLPQKCTFTSRSPRRRRQVLIPSAQWEDGVRIGDHELD